MSQLTTTSLLAEATTLLEHAGYARVGESELSERRLSTARLFEDRYGVVLVTAWQEWETLREQWPQAQGVLVEIMSEHIPRTDAKAWDGYLVLLLPVTLALENHRQLEEIRRDTTRVRKLVADGRDLQSLADVERALAPLLPLSLGDGQLETRTVVDNLAQLIDDPELPREWLPILAQGFAEGESLIESLHRVGLTR